jgi:hypothetical protein
MKSKDFVDRMVAIENEVQFLVGTLVAENREILAKQMASLGKKAASIRGMIHESVTMDDQLDLSFAEGKKAKKDVDKET